MPFFSTAIFPSLETLRQRVEDVLSPLNLAVDQDTIALHVDLSAGASVIGVDRYWILRFVWTASTLTVCQRVESSATNSFPGTLRSEVCSVYGSIPAAIDLSVLVATFLASLLPGFGTVNTQVIPPPLPDNSPVVTTLPDDDPVVVHPGGSDPVSTSTPVVSVYGAHLEWLDASGTHRHTWFYASTLSGAAQIADDLQSCSQAICLNRWIGPVETNSDDPATDPYALVSDDVRIVVQFPGGGQESLVLPAPDATRFLADQLTLNPANSRVADLYADLAGNLWSAAAAATASAVLIGLRDRQAAGGSL